MIDLYYNQKHTVVDENVFNDSVGNYIEFNSRSEIYRFIRELFELLKDEEEQT